MWHYSVLHDHDWVMAGLDLECLASKPSTSWTAVAASPGKMALQVECNLRPHASAICSSAVPILTLIPRLD